MSDKWVTTRELYHELEKVGARVGRVEKALIVIAILTASPKLGGPTVPQVVTAVLGVLGG